jgi:hypothetical protein
MAGQYLNKKDKYKIFLSDWIDNSIRNKSWEKYQDLHLDAIDSEYSQKENWIEGSFFIYEIILNILKNESYSCLLVITLSYSDTETDINSLTWEKIDSFLDLTPPSLYLFPIGEEGLEETIKNLIFLERLSNETAYRIFFRQEEECVGEYNRSIYIIRR